MGLDPEREQRDRQFTEYIRFENDKFEQGCCLFWFGACRRKLAVDADAVPLPPPRLQQQRNELFRIGHHRSIEPGGGQYWDANVNGALRVTAFPHLFSPIQIGSVTVKNRILSSGHDTVMAEGGMIGDRLVAYQEARAKGGAGLIVLQVAGVHESAKYSSSVLMADTDECIPG